MEPRLLLSMITVNSTGDADGADGSDTLSLRQAIEISNGTLPVKSLTPAQQGLVTLTSSPANTIDFALSAANLSQTLSITGNPTGGTFTLTTVSPLPAGTTTPLPYNATVSQVQAALTSILGNSNVVVSGGPALPGHSITIDYTGQYAGQAIPPLLATSSLTGGSGTQIVVTDPTVLNVPAPGFDPGTQDWTIKLGSALPPITHQVTIDGLTQAATQVPFRYPSEVATQSLAITGNPTGGTFTLTTSAPLPPNMTTTPIPVGASRATVQAALESIVGAGNVIVTGGATAQGSTYTITFVGAYDGVTIPPLTTTYSLIGGTAPLVAVFSSPETAPTEITSAPNTFSGPATAGNNATPRLIIDGTGTDGATGFVLDTSDSILRGLVIEGFGVGVSVPAPGDVGDLIQGNDIGNYPIFPVDPETGIPLTDVPLLEVTGQGNSLQGVLLDSTNATVGGVEEQDSNVIIGNGQQGVSILPGAHGNQVLGNQIGIIGIRALMGPYLIVGNGSDGVRIQDSSNYVGGAATGAGNLISGNLGDGVQIVGTAATRNDILGNVIGAGPSGGFLFGSDIPGNLGDGVGINNASANNVGGTAAADRNVISGNGGAGVRIFGAPAVDNSVQGNYIGITEDGVSALGNSQEGVVISSADNIVGPGNVISANLRGVLLFGIGATDNLVQSNLIGTNASGTADLGNAQEGVLIDSAPNNSITGNAQGSQVISGNNVGLLILGDTASGNQVLGNFVGTDVTGTLDLGNSQAGVEIDDAPANLVGGSSATATNRNLIAADHKGVVITGSLAAGNVLQGNFIGTEITGQKSLGNEIDGVFINEGASFNLIGGSSALTGNTIAFSQRDGVRIEDASVSNAILSNSIFANLGLGIDLVPPAISSETGPNMLPNSPTLTAVATSISATIINGTLVSTPNTTFTIQFFFSSTLDVTGMSEGGQYVGQTTATTDADGFASYSANVPAVLKPGQLVTATATDPAGNTSEFSSPLGEIFGTVQFSMASYTVSEGVGTATIVATRTGGSGGYFTVNYATADGTGAAGSAYSPASGTLTFQPGENTQTFPVTILDNGGPEGDVSVLLGLSSPVGPIMLGTQSTAVLTILGNQPGAFQFQMSDYSVDEAAGTATITVTRDQAGLTSTVNYSTAPGTAVAGIDYVTTSGTLTFNPGVFTQTFTIPILINPLIKANETVLLNLSTPSSNASLGSPSSAVLVIIDDGIDRMGPEVTSVRAVSGPVGVAEVVIGFNEPLDPATAVNLLNYGYAVRTAGRDGKLDTKDDRLVGISSATYNPAILTVTLPLGFAVPNDTKLLLQINEATDVAGAGVGVSDVLGNLLDATGDGHPGGAYSAVAVAEPAPKPVTVKAAKSSSQKAKPVKHPVKVTPAKSQPKARSTHH